MARSEQTEKTTVPTTTTFNWDVEMHPRNLPPTQDRAVHVQVTATSKQEAINKAITQKPGHTWGEVRQLEGLPPERNRHEIRVRISPDSLKEVLTEAMPWNPTDYGKSETIDELAAAVFEHFDIYPKPVDQGTVEHKTIPNIDLSHLMAQHETAMHRVAESVVNDYAERVRVPQPPIPAAFSSDPNETLWMTPWEPTRRDGEELTLAQIVQEAIASASMCWRDEPSGSVFDDQKAAWVAGGATNAIEKVVFWQTGFHPGGKSMTMEEAEDHVDNADYKAKVERIRKLEECAPLEAGMAVEPPEAIAARIQRDADKARVVELILSYRNHASDDEKLRQIRVVLD